MANIPVVYTLTIDADTSDADYTGVSKTITATGSKWTITGPLAEALKRHETRLKSASLEHAARLAENFSTMEHAAHDIRTKVFPKKSRLGEAIAASIRELKAEDDAPQTTAG